MLLTEEEAKERWCPFVGRFDQEAGACRASKCQMWRWQPLMADQPFLDAVKQHMELSDDSHAKAVKHVRANLAEYGLPDKPFRGICGLAGALLK